MARTRSVAPGTGDNMAGALGVGLRSGDVAVSIGTSGTVYSVSDEPIADPSGIVAGFADATGRHLPLVCTLNATKVTDAVRRLLGVDHDAFDELALGAPRRAPAGSSCCRTSTASGPPTARTRPVSSAGSAATSAASSSPGRPSRASCAGCSTGSTRSACSPPRAVACSWSVAVPGQRAYRQVLADLTGRAVLVPHDDEQVAAGACVQAAAVATGAEPADVADQWRLGDGDLVEPGPGAAAAADVRGAYAALREAS